MLLAYQILDFFSFSLHSQTQILILYCQFFPIISKYLLFVYDFRFWVWYCRSKDCLTLTYIVVILCFSNKLECALQRCVHEVHYSLFVGQHKGKTMVPVTSTPHQKIMAIKVIFQIMAFALVFTLFTSYHAGGEGDCYNKELVNIKCRETIQIGSPCLHLPHPCNCRTNQDNSVVLMLSPCLD